MIEQYGHAGGKNFPEMPQVLKNKILSNREIEVLSLVVQGFINKEIATKLNISLTTVITHRKNIMEKLGMKSVSALTIYAVMHGYVDISKIFGIRGMERESNLTCLSTSAKEFSICSISLLLV